MIRFINHSWYCEDHRVVCIILILFRFLFSWIRLFLKWLQPVLSCFTYRKNNESERERLFVTERTICWFPFLKILNVYTRFFLIWIVYKACRLFEQWWPYGWWWMIWEMNCCYDLSFGKLNVVWYWWWDDLLHWRFIMWLF